jgi:predicted nucleic acid-binding protein
MSVPRLLDTSAISLYLAPRAVEKTPRLVNTLDNVIATDGVRLSIVTYYEIDRGLQKLELGGHGRKKRQLFNMFLSTATVFGLDNSSYRGWTVAAELHARAATASPAIVFEEGDLLILATALAHEMQLLTCDHRLAHRASDLGLGDRVEQVEVS